VGEGGCSIQGWRLFYTATLGRSTIYLIIIILFISFLRALLFSPFVLIWLRKGANGVSEGGVNTRGQLGRLQRPPTLLHTR
jgi:hypothetical protein